MSDTCEVVRVVSAEHADCGGFKEINKSDLTKDHVLWEAQKEAPKEPEGDAFSTMSIKDMQAYLTASGIPFAQKADLNSLRRICRAPRGE